jgi:Tfp pilus assembly protein PilF
VSSYYCIWRRLDNQSAEVDALISLGLAHMKAGNRQNAVRYLEDALDMLLVTVFVLLYQ